MRCRRSRRVWPCRPPAEADARHVAVKSERGKAPDQTVGEVSRRLGEAPLVAAQPEFTGESNTIGQPHAGAGSYREGRIPIGQHCLSAADDGAVHEK
jgi:hypothetical protein